MGNVLSDEKKQQVLALGRLGWSLRRIEEATGVRRETSSGYLRAVGIAVRPARQWGHGHAKAAKEVISDPGCDADSNPAKEPIPDSESPMWRGPARSPAASACEPYREVIEEGLGRGRNAKAIWQDLVTEHGFAARYASVQRFARKVRGACVPDASAMALSVGVANYRFVRRYLDRQPAPQLSLRQVDPLIRDLTHYRDIIRHITKETE